MWHGTCANEWWLWAGSTLPLDCTLLWTRQRLDHVVCWLDSRTHEMDEKWMDFWLTPQSHVTPKHAGVRGGVEEKEVSSQGSLYDWTRPAPSTTSTKFTKHTNDQLTCEGRSEWRLFFFRISDRKNSQKRKKRRKLIWCMKWRLRVTIQLLNAISWVILNENNLLDPHPLVSMSKKYILEWSPCESANILNHKMADSIIFFFSEKKNIVLLFSNEKWLLPVLLTNFLFVTTTIALWVMSHEPKATETKLSDSPTPEGMAA